MTRRARTHRSPAERCRRRYARGVKRAILWLAAPLCVLGALATAWLFELSTERVLLLAPNVAQMYTTGEIAANICLETPGLDTLDILVLWKGFPTYASTQTIFTILKANWYYLVQNKFVEWDVTANFEVNVPGQHEGAIAVPWGGTAMRSTCWIRRIHSHTR